MFFNKINFVYKILTAYGLRYCLFRTQYAFKKKLGLQKRKFANPNWKGISITDWVKPRHIFPPSEFIENHLNLRRNFFFDSQSIAGLNKELTSNIKIEADIILDNQFRFFFDQYHSLGSPPDWFLNPLTGKRARSQDKHWCDVNFFDPELGDIKFIWESSRFSWVYTLVRAYAATQDDKYIDKFWTLFESWLEVNRPNTGPNFSCGQECAIRLFAMCFAFHAVKNAKSTTSERMFRLALAIGIHADRIEKNIEFAISTNTNHSITEAVGIYTAGILFPEFKAADKWLTRGKKILEKEVLRQIYEDGGYLQHSMNYHRLMLQNIIWAVHLGKLNNDSFSQPFLNRVEKAVDFLFEMVDDETGRAPNYGANDGAIIIPLNSCDYLDYRPVLQACFWLFKGIRVYKEGLWDEDSYWFYSNEFRQSEVATIKRKSSEFLVGGYYTVKNDNNWALFRCHTYFDRPGDAGMLHLDLWWKGLNILRDAGSYMYNCPKPWAGYFGSTQAHNTVTINGESHLKGLSRFMSTNWTQSKLISNKENDGGDIKFISGEHYGYCYESENLIHRRGILSLGADNWLIIDDLIGTDEYKFDLSWHISDFEVQAQENGFLINTPKGKVDLRVFSNSCKITSRKFLGEIDEDKPAGWHSLHYGNKQPAPTLRFSSSFSENTRVMTSICLGTPFKKLEWKNEFEFDWYLENERVYKIKLNNVAKSMPEILSSIAIDDQEPVLLD